MIDQINGSEPSLKAPGSKRAQAPVAQTKPAPAMLDIVLRFFSEDQWNFKLVEPNVIRAGYHGEHGTWICQARVDEANQRFVFLSMMGLNIPPHNRLAVMEYINRVNWGLPIGNFEMNLETGDVRFKTCIETPECALTETMVRSLVYINLHTIDHYFPGVVAVLHGGLSPEDALARIASLPSDNPRSSFVGE